MNVDTSVKIFEIIEKMGVATVRQLIAETGMRRERVRASLRNMKRNGCINSMEIDNPYSDVGRRGVRLKVEGYFPNKNGLRPNAMGPRPNLSSKLIEGYIRTLQRAGYIVLPPDQLKD